MSSSLLKVISPVFTFRLQLKSPYESFLLKYISSSYIPSCLFLKPHFWNWAVWTENGVRQSVQSFIPTFSLQSTQQLLFTETFYTYVCIGSQRWSTLIFCSTTLICLYDFVGGKRGGFLLWITMPAQWKPNLIANHLHRLQQHIILQEILCMIWS